MKRSALVRLGNPVLRARAKRVSKTYFASPEFKRLIRRLIRVMRENEGVGIAAPQIGVPLQVAVLEMHPTKFRPDLPHKGPLTIVNPEILEIGPLDTKSVEGCLSFPGPDGEPYRGELRRHRWVRVAYTDSSGNRVEEVARGLWAHIFQHEIDHLNGTLFIDRMDLRSLADNGEFAQRHRRNNS